MTANFWALRALSQKIGHIEEDNGRPEVLVAHLRSGVVEDFDGMRIKLEIDSALDMIADLSRELSYRQKDGV